MNKKWWKAAGIRAVKTMAQAMLGVLGGASLISEVDWKVVLSSAIIAGVCSLLTSLNGLPELEVIDEEGE